MTATRTIRAQQKAMPVIGYLHFGSPDLAPTPAVFLVRRGREAFQASYSASSNAMISLRPLGFRIVAGTVKTPFLRHCQKVESSISNSLRMVFFRTYFFGWSDMCSPSS